MRLMVTKDIIGKILVFFNLQSPSLQMSCFRVLLNFFNGKGKFILNLKLYGKLVSWIILKSYWKYWGNRLKTKDAMRLYQSY